MKYITSRYNPIIKKIIELKTAKKRLEYGLFIAEGYRTITTFLHHGYQLDAAFTTQKGHSILQSHIQNNEIILLDDHTMGLISSSTTPSGMLALFKIPKTPEPHLLTPGIVLAQIQDPGNMGTIIRTAAALAVPSIVIVEGCDPWNPKVVQATAGSLALVTVFSWTWQQLLDYKKNIPLCALTVSDGQPPQKYNLKEQLFVVGNEAHGLPEEWQQQCDHFLTLPMPGNTESLNAAIAAAITLYITYQPLS
ncbi:MAG: RNA methyltransferase [Candidatus Babeliaceae bacterium]